MGVYFSSHRKKKNFPYSLFGFLALAVFAGLILYLSISGKSLTGFFTNGPDETITGLTGIALIVMSSLIYLLSIGIVAEIHGKLKSPLYLLQFVYFALAGTSGYFIGTSSFGTFIVFMMAAGFLYF